MQEAGRTSLSRPSVPSVTSLAVTRVQSWPRMQCGWWEASLWWPRSCTSSAAGLCLRYMCGTYMYCIDCTCTYTCTCTCTYISCVNVHVHVHVHNVYMFGSCVPHSACGHVSISCLYPVYIPPCLFSISCLTLLSFVYPARHWWVSSVTLL